jgi:prepilin-type N-terminal cleavage/methylation domain-containing protein
VPLTRLVGRMRPDAGFTLIELMVALAIGLIVMLSVYALIDVGSKTSDRVTDRTDASQRGRIGMEQMVRSLRAQTCYGAIGPVIAASDDSVTFYADNGGAAPDRRQLEYTPSDGAITERVWRGVGVPPNVTWPDPPIVRNITIGLERLPGVSFFRYYGWTTAGAVRPTVLLGPAPLPAADLPDVVRIEVNFRAASSRQPASDGATFTSGVVSRTADPSNPARGSQCT